MKRHEVKNRCIHCGTWEKYQVDAEDTVDAETSMVNFKEGEESLGKLECLSVREL